MAPAAISASASTMQCGPIKASLSHPGTWINDRRRMHARFGSRLRVQSGQYARQREVGIFTKNLQRRTGLQRFRDQNGRGFCRGGLAFVLAIGQKTEISRTGISQGANPPDLEIGGQWLDRL